MHRVICAEYVENRLYSPLPMYSECVSYVVECMYV
jgi:hypothetical protein